MLALFLLGLAAFSSADDLKQKLSQIPQCKEFIDHNPTMQIPNCNEQVNQCFNEVGDISTRCIHELLAKHPELKNCSEVGDAKKAWLGAGCEFYESITSCMNNEAPYGKFVAMETASGSEEHTTHSPHGHGHNHHAHADHSCWAELEQKKKTCIEQANAQCTNFNYCTGQETPTDAASDQAKWSKISKHLFHEKEEKLREAYKVVQKCKHNGNQGSHSGEH